MKHPLAMIALAAIGLSLASCDGDDYTYGVGMGWGPGPDYAYNTWYDGYYGPLYDGYWGADNYFYYRSNDHDRAYHRGDGRHFYRQAPSGGGNWRHYEGHARPDQGTHMPNFPGRGVHGDRGNRGGHDYRR